MSEEYISSFNDEDGENFKKSTDRVIRTVPKDEALVVRFRHNPTDGWIKYREHWTGQAYAICKGRKDCELCDEGSKASDRALAEVLDTGKDEVYALKLPKTLVRSLLNILDEMETLTDADYKLTRSGEGMSIQYSVIQARGGNKPRKFKDAELDLGALLKQEFEL